MIVSVRFVSSWRPARRAVCFALGLLLAAGGTTAQAGTASAGITINLAVLSKSNCRFATLPPTLMDFGVVNMASTSDISMSVPAVMDCKGSAAVATYAVSVSNGLYHNGATRRMRHTATPTNFLAYSASVSPDAGTVAKNTPVGLTLTATIPVSALHQAVEGLYSDTITVTVLP